jgi:hypothetical protein
MTLVRRFDTRGDANSTMSCGQSAAVLSWVDEIVVLMLLDRYSFVVIPIRNAAPTHSATTPPASSPSALVAQAC